VFYVERKDSAAEPVPPVIEFVPAGASRPVELPTDVVETPRDVEE